jgi:hypothetical protein
MKRVIIIGAIMIMLGTLLVVATGCFGNANAIGNNPTVTPGLKPKPKILPVVMTTTGTANAYYTVLDIKVNEGAEGCAG